MKRLARFCITALFASLVAASASAESFTVLTYNLGLLRVVGTDFVPIVDQRSKAAPSALAAALAQEQPSIVLFEEVWREQDAIAIAKALEPLGYTAARPDVSTLFGLSSGLVLLVKAPVRLVDWRFTPFTANTFLDGLATRKGVLEATLESAATSRRFVLVGTHTVAIDTDNGEPKDSSEARVFESQADQILAALRARSANAAIPALLMGDFNVGPGYADSLYRQIADSGALREAGATLFPGSPLVTWDPQNPLVKYGKYPNEPAAKIDHVFVEDGADAHWTIDAARVLFKDPVEGLTVSPGKDAAPVASTLSDHYAFLAELELQ